MKDRLIKGFGLVMFYVLVMGCCIFVGAMVYLTAYNLFPVPEGLPAVRVGKTWVIREGDLRFVADRRPGWPKGRPRKRRKRRR